VDVVAEVAQLPVGGVVPAAGVSHAPVGVVQRREMSGSARYIQEILGDRQFDVHSEHVLTRAVNIEELARGTVEIELAMRAEQLIGVFQPGDAVEGGQTGSVDGVPESSTPSCSGADSR
jgi:hypothetical protein